MLLVRWIVMFEIKAIVKKTVVLVLMAMMVVVVEAVVTDVQK